MPIQLIENGDEENEVDVSPHVSPHVSWPCLGVQPARLGGAGRCAEGAERYKREGGRGGARPLMRNTDPRIPTSTREDTHSAGFAAFSRVQLCSAVLAPLVLTRCSEYSAHQHNTVLTPSRGCLQTSPLFPSHT